MKTLPVKIFVTYIIITLILSFFGPLKYINYDKFSVLIYMSLFLLAITAGCFLANRKKIVFRKRKIYEIKNNKGALLEKKILKFLSVSIKIALISIFIEFLEILINNPNTFSFSNMATNYLKVRENTHDSGFYSIPMIFRFATGFFRNITLILSFYYWERIGKKNRKRFIVFIILLFVVNMLAYGTQKFVGDIIIYFIVVMAIKKIKFFKTFNKKYLLFAGLVVIGTILFFGYVQAERYAMLGVTPENFRVRSDGYQYYDTNHIIFKLFGERYGLGLAAILASYLSAGYYGLSLTLHLPFQWTYGIGNSYFMSKLVSTIFGIENMYYRTYLGRMGEVFGRDGLRSWNTIFPWLASDFTFAGTILFFFFVGYLWQISWIEVIKYKNPVSLVLFTTLSLGLVYVPANNQLFNGIDSYIATVCVLLFWIFNHKKYNYTM